MSYEAASRYVMGHTDRERRRLALQASILEPFTEALFRRAGIVEGMRVLDIGCGVGDVSLLAARLVGRSGSITSVDIDADALKTLGSRAAAAHISNINCVQADVHNFNPSHRFDAVVGRHILIHTTDPLAILRACHGLLNPRGVAAFQEYDFRQFLAGNPATPERDKVFALFSAFFRATVQAGIGSSLYYLFSEAGFANPVCRGEIPVDGGPDSPFYEWIVESVRAILPRAKGLQIPETADIDLDTLETRLLEEAVSSGSGFCGPVMFGCFGRRA